MMLQTMFSSPILHIEELHPGYGMVGKNKL